MKYNWIEVLTGAAVLVLAVVFFGYASRIAGGGATGDTYPLVAEFVSAEGVSAGGEIRMAGVKVGTVGEMELNAENFTADVQLNIDTDVMVPADSEVKIASDGLLGGSFVEIVPGADAIMLEPGEKFTYTSGSVSLLSLLASFVGGAASSGAGE